MMQSRLARVLVVMVATILLLVPSMLMTFAWGGTLNLEVAIVAALIAIATAKWIPGLRWPIAFLASLLIAVPPYPYWTDWGEERGQYLHFFHGFTLQTLPVATFVVVFALAMLLFMVIFRSIAKPA